MFSTGAATVHQMRVATCLPTEFYSMHTLSLIASKDISYAAIHGPTLLCANDMYSTIPAIRDRLTLDVGKICKLV